MKLSFMFFDTKNIQLISFWNEGLVDRLIIIITQNFVNTVMLTDAAVRNLVERDKRVTFKIADHLPIASAK